ncbi:MAG: BON domain-containing protein [Aquabacterium sp.]|jgi:osmotically-inducible protein OsmY|uniref:BON domain-containing protein n=1 Tax=Aquabacterium sp. TaxID=1872578 RepID=UPI002A369AFD|nr:BON domain-containing protein [Aquabacterium sp.]MDX9842581.1 BON domain-containing protein [Aquabacterium sp.]
MTRLTFTPTVLRWTAALAAALSLSACAPLVLGTAVGGAFVATDRRTSGMQLEDQGIKIKAANRIREVLKDRGNVNVNAYNRRVLLTGEVPTEADRAAAVAAAAQTENVAGVVNELIVSLSSTLTSRSSDVLVATKVRATLVDARDLMSNAFDVVVERGDVYLMGIVTEREANRAAELVSTISGVRRVVKVFEIISEDELARKLPKPVSPAASDSTQP